MALAVALGIAVGGCATVDRDDLRSDVTAVHSAAAEGALLAGEAGAHRAPTPFVWMHSAELRHHVLEVSDRLEGEMEAPEVTGEVPTVKRLTERVAQALGRLHAQPTDSQVALAVRHSLLDASDATETLSEKLG